MSCRRRSWALRHRRQEGGRRERSNAQLGLDIVELYREVRPTWKLDLKFDPGLPGVEVATSPGPWVQGRAERVSVSPRGRADDVHPPQEATR